MFQLLPLEGGLLGGAAAKWYRDTMKAVTEARMKDSAWWRHTLVDNLNQPSLSLLEHKWFNSLFSETYGWMIVASFVVPAVLGIFIVLSMRVSKKLRPLASDAVGIAMYAITITFVLHVSIYLTNLVRAVLTRATGADAKEWVLALTPVSHSFWINLLYIVLLAISSGIMFAAQYLASFFVLLWLVAWGFRSWGHRGQQFFNRVIAFGVASLLAKLFFTAGLSLGSKLAEGQPPTLRIAIGAFTFICTILVCLAVFLGGSVAATRILDGASEVEGEVIAKTDDRLSVEGDVRIENDSLFSPVKNTVTGDTNSQRLGRNQGPAPNSIVDPVADSHIVQALAKSDKVQTVNAVLDAVPDSVILAAGTAAGVPEASAINAGRKQLMDRVNDQPSD